MKKFRIFRKNVIPQKKESFNKPANQLTIDEYAGRIILTTKKLIKKRQIFLQINNKHISRFNHVVIIPISPIPFNYMIRIIKIFEGGFIVQITNICAKTNFGIEFDFVT